MSSTTETLAEMADVTIRVLQQTCCDQYRWMTIAAGIFGFLMAFGIGANDVANAFATSVSAKSISLVSQHMLCMYCICWLVTHPFLSLHVLIESIETSCSHRCCLRVPWGYASWCICDIDYS